VTHPVQSPDNAQLFGGLATYTLKIIMYSSTWGH
jgi:hypothetical protein